MKRLTFAAVMCVICVAIIACSDDGGGGSANYTSDVNDYTPSVYVAGAVSTGTGSNACYWKDGLRVDLPGDGGIAYGIAVANGHVYVVGRADSNACVWIDGVKEDLDGDYAWGIKIVDNTVYISGTNDNNRACIWINGIRDDIEGSNDSSAYGIYIENDTIYVTGDRMDTDSNYKASLWSKALSGGTWNRQDLQTGSYEYSAGLSVIVNNGTIYVAGEQYDSSTYYPFIWSGTSVTSLAEAQLPIPNAYSSGGNEDGDGHAHNVYVYNSKVYTVGYYKVDDGNGSYYYRAALWIDSSNPALYAPDDDNNSAAFSVHIYNGDIYVAGNIEKPKNESEVYVQPCYWKNGVRVELDAPEYGNNAKDYYNIGAHAIVVQ